MEEDLQIKRLDFNIETERRRYEGLDKHFIETKNRRLLLVSAELAIFAYLFSDIQSLIPDELYGRLFFAAGVLAGITSLALSFFHCRPVVWPDPIGEVEEVKISASETELEWKEVAYNDYRNANIKCKQILSTHARTMTLSLISFVISIIILLVIKFF